MKYEIPVQEKISIWQDMKVLIETNDTPEQIEKHIRDGSFASKYSPVDYIEIEYMHETEETLEQSFEQTQPCDIKEVE